MPDVCSSAPEDVALWITLHVHKLAIVVADRVTADRRDTRKLVHPYRAGQLSCVEPPTPETEGLRDLRRRREDLRRARTSARHRLSKQLLRHGRIERAGRSRGMRMHRDAPGLGRPSAAR